MVALKEQEKDNSHQLPCKVKKKCEPDFGIIIKNNHP